MTGSSTGGRRARSDWPEICEGKWNACSRAGGKRGKWARTTRCVPTPLIESSPACMAFTATEHFSSHLISLWFYGLRRPGMRGFSAQSCQIDSLQAAAKEKPNKSRNLQPPSGSDLIELFFDWSQLEWEAELLPLARVYFSLLLMILDSGCTVIARLG